MAHPFASMKIWFDKSVVEAAENNYQAKKAGCDPNETGTPSLVSEIKNIKDHIRGALQRGSGSTDDLDEAAMQRIQSLEKENKALRSLIEKLEQRVAALELGEAAPAQSAKKEEAPADDDDDEIDLFGSEDEEEEAEAAKIREERLAAYAAKKSKKPAVVAKSSILFDVKPWDDETDMAAMEAQVRTIEMDGLLWGASKLVPLAYGIKKLQIMCVIEDEKVSTEDLEDKIKDFEDFVQSVDIAAFSKI